MNFDSKIENEFSGRHMISIRNFRGITSERLAPLSVAVKLFDDWSEIQFIKADNRDRIFQLYEYQSQPSIIDLLNTIFCVDKNERIVDLDIVSIIVWADKLLCTYSAKVNVGDYCAMYN